MAYEEVANHWFLLHSRKETIDIEQSLLGDVASLPGCCGSGSPVESRLTRLATLGFLPFLLAKTVCLPL